jgi:hypothetical protein
MSHVYQKKTYTRIYKTGAFYPSVVKKMSLIMGETAKYAG